MYGLVLYELLTTKKAYPNKDDANAFGTYERFFNVLVERYANKERKNRKQRDALSWDLLVDEDKKEQPRNSQKVHP